MNTKNTGLLVIALIVILGVSVALFSPQEKAETKQVTATKNETSSVSTHYKNGMYEKKGAYSSPAGLEQIDVTLTINEGIVTEASVTPEAENPKSVYMQRIFIENYKSLVVGKSIKDLHLNKVAGSSLTPKGFNDAVEKIKAEAQS